MTTPEIVKEANLLKERHSIKKDYSVISQIGADGNRSIVVIDDEIETIRVRNKSVQNWFLYLDIVLILYFIVYPVIWFNYEGTRFGYVSGPIMEIMVALIFTISAFRLSK